MVTKTSHLPISYLLALLWAHPILHVSRIRVNCEVSRGFLQGLWSYKAWYVTGWAIQVAAAFTCGETGPATTYIWPDILLATWNLPSSSTHQSAGYHTQLYGGRICYSHPYIAAGNLLLYLNFSDKPLLGKTWTNLKALRVPGTLPLFSANLASVTETRIWWKREMHTKCYSENLRDKTTWWK